MRDAVIISSTAALTRNFADLPFDTKGRADLASVVISRVAGVLVDHGFSLQLLREMSEDDRYALRESGLIHSQLLKAEKTSAVMLKEEAPTSVMLAGSEHVTVISHRGGLALPLALEDCFRVEDLLSAKVEFAYDDELGYLTARPEITGTGINANIRVHVPMLIRARQLGEVAEELRRQGLVLYAPVKINGAPEGDMLEICNLHALGRTEQEICNALTQAAEKIRQMEMGLREQSMQDNRVSLQDRTFRALGTLRLARLLTLEECWRLWSDLRLGVALGFVPLPLERVDAMISELRPAHLRVHAGKPLSGEALDACRAVCAREILGEIWDPAANNGKNASSERRYMRTPNAKEEQTMAGSFMRFNAAARKALEIARHTAAQENQKFVGTVHLLYGLMMAGGNYPQEFWKKVTASYVRKVIHGLKTEADESTDKDSPLSMTPNAHQLLDRAVHVSRPLGQLEVGTEALLLAITNPAAPGKPMAATSILQRCGVNLQAATEYLRAVLSGQTPDNGKGKKPEQPPKREQPEKPQLSQPGQEKKAKPEKPEESGHPLNSAPNPGAKQDFGMPQPRANVRKARTMLDQYGRDLTEDARQDKLMPVIGRDKEINRVIQILIRFTKSNPVLIGEPGVGKTSVVEGLAQRIAVGDVPDMMLNKRVIMLDINSMVAGAKYRGEFEERIKGVVEEVRKAGDVILFVDEMHDLVGTGSAEGSQDAADILKPALARGEIQCIGATTLDEYRKYIEKDAALERRFQPVRVDEPNNGETLAILHGLRGRYEKHHGVHITDDALDTAVQLASRYIPDRRMPDKAIDLMDEACSRVRIAAFTSSPELRQKESEIQALEEQKRTAAECSAFEEAAELHRRIAVLREDVEKLRADKGLVQPDQLSEVTTEDIAEVVSVWTGIPVTKMSESEKEKLLHLEEELHKRVVGQDESIRTVARAMRRARAGLKDPKRPIGSFIFLGPTGVGKTELCRALGEAMFGDENAMIRIDMSEYSERHTVSRLIGSPPGYVGHEEAGQLTEAVRRKPYSVVLFDEVEKAHPAVFNLMLQVLEDGRLTDGSGRVVSFKNTIIVMTSNAGAHDLMTARSMGFHKKEGSAEDYGLLRETVMKAVKDVFRPEFINRVDELIVFHALTKEDIRVIAGLMLRQVANRLAERAIHMTWDEAVEEKLSSEGFDPKYGARPLRRLIQRTVEDLLSEELLAGNIALGDAVHLTVKDKSIVAIKPEKSQEEAELPAELAPTADAPAESVQPEYANVAEEEQNDPDFLNVFKDDDLADLGEITPEEAAKPLRDFRDTRLILPDSPEADVQTESDVQKKLRLMEEITRLAQETLNQQPKEDVAESLEQPAGEAASKEKQTQSKKQRTRKAKADEADASEGKQAQPKKPRTRKVKADEAAAPEEKPAKPRKPRTRKAKPDETVDGTNAE